MRNQCKKKKEEKPGSSPSFLLDETTTLPLTIPQHPTKDIKKKTKAEQN
jgi:hypothetical protein